MVSILFVSIFISLFVSIFSMPWWIKKCRSIGMVWEDMNKFTRPKNVAASGGVIVLVAFILGVFSYIAIQTFVLKDNTTALEIFALVSVILILGVIGLVDDLLGWKNGGLSARLRLVLALIASIPLVVINAGQHSILLPIFGNVNLGVLYTFILIPLAITATTTVYNFLAGFNGLESGQGILILSFLSFVAYITGSAWLSLVGLCMVASLIGFWIFNKTPAKVFPGDILTYSVGALIGIMAILGNFERIAFVVFVPYIIEMILKVRGALALHNGKFPQSFGVPQKDGSLKLKYNNIYGLTHLGLFVLGKFKQKVYENDVVYFIHGIQIIFIIIACLML